MDICRILRKWFELKTRLGKDCTIDKLNSEGLSGGYEARTGPGWGKESVLTAHLLNWEKARSACGQPCRHSLGV
jgi:hypothetical protein